LLGRAREIEGSGYRKKIPDLMKFHIVFPRRCSTAPFSLEY
jgi:hypothetical protein